ncbi:hypothetical protein M9Y10_040259 [Tritrichomonas musculus]|uniref:Uncharacterized protein n=1 Tax=Tritrichomonas musculus TaxID=1915356 RepID=A0ABR2GQE2_9EUKA
MSSKKKKSQSHIPQTHDEIRNMLNGERNPDKKYHDKALKHAIDFIEYNGIKDECHIVEYLTELGFTSPEIKVLILDFKKEYNINAEITGQSKIEWFSPRDIRQMADPCKNSIISELATEHNAEFNNFIPRYLRKIKPDSSLLDEMTLKIKANANLMYVLSHIHVSSVLYPDFPFERDE